MFVILVNYLQPLSAVEPHVAAHRQFLDRQYAAGHFLASGPRVPRTGGIILAQGLSREALEAVLAEDPFQQQKLAAYEILEFQPNKAAPDLAARLGVVAD